MLTVPLCVLDDVVVVVRLELELEPPPHANSISRQAVSSTLQIKPTLFPLISPHFEITVVLLGNRWL